ncbi:hypothetical protein ACFC0D_19295 [Streptomyces sp. NPDC056222]|uniref:hypothetical protein n=1 Tax=Streptomyces sp. NPDC056222 TaxID=3345749 RepID=UPI0035DE11B2
MMFILFGVLFVVPQFLQQVQGKDAMDTGLHLLPMTGALIIAAGIGGRLVGNRHQGHRRHRHGALGRRSRPAGHG